MVCITTSMIPWKYSNSGDKCNDLVQCIEPSINTFLGVAICRQDATFSSVTLLVAMSFLHGDRFCMSRKSVTGGGGWMH